jgi:hypothetical protein
MAEDEVSEVRRQLIGDALVDDQVSPVASAARSAFRLGWNAAQDRLTPRAEEDAVFDFINWLRPQNITFARWDRDADGGLVPLAEDGALWERWKTERKQ